MTEWIQAHETILLWMLADSVVVFLATLILIPLLIVRLPSDYFAAAKRHRTPWADHHPVLRGVLVAGKNLLGYVFVLAGIAMLLLPGQGLLTIAIGIMLVDFPGKFRLERWFISRRQVLRPINWLRRRAGKKPLVF